MKEMAAQPSKHIDAPTAPAVKDAFKLFSLLMQSREGVSEEEASELFEHDEGRTKSAIANLITSAVAELDPTNTRLRYRYAMLHNFKNAIRNQDFLRRCLPEIMELRNECGESTYCTFDLEGEAVVLGVELSSHLEHDSVAPGTVLKFESSSAGRALMAFMDRSRLARQLKKIHAAEDQTSGFDQQALLDELADIRSKGYALEAGEVNTGNCSISVPVFSPSGGQLAALTVAGPNYRIQGERIAELARALMGAAHKVQIGLNTSLVPPAQLDQPILYGAPTCLSSQSPQWDENTQEFIWFDATENAVYRASPKENKRTCFRPAEGVVGVVLGHDGRLYSMGGNVVIDTSNGKQVQLDSACRCAFPGPDNDLLGVIDQSGLDKLVLFGEHGHYTELVSFEHRASCLAYCRHSRSVYIGFEASRSIFCYSLNSKRLQQFKTFTSASGYPQSMAIDRQGNLIVAMARGWSLVKLSVNGDELARANLSVCYPTGLVLGGRDGTDLMVTSEVRDLPQAVFDQAPLNGCAFVVPLPQNFLGPRNQMIS